MHIDVRIQCAESPAYIFEKTCLCCVGPSHFTCIFQIDGVLSLQKNAPRSKVACNMFPSDLNENSCGLVKSQGRRWRTQSWVTSEKGGIYIYIYVSCTKSYLDDDSKTQLKAPVVITTHQKIIAIHLMFHHFTYRRYTGAIFELAFLTFIRPPPQKKRSSWT